MRILSQTHPAHAAALSGIGSLGDDSTTLANLGFTQDQINQIITAHNDCSLSEQGYQGILQGQVNPPSMLQAWLDSDPGCPPGAEGPSSVAGATGAGVPTGSTVTYVSTWSTSIQAGENPPSIIQAVAQTLAGQGLTVTGSDIVSQASWASGLVHTSWPFTVNLQIHVGDAGHAQASDVGQIVDHAAYQITGVMPTGTQASLTYSAPAGGGGGGGGGSALNMTAFFEQNAPWLLLGLGAVLLLPALIERR
jgi:hypothetical protein